MIPTRRARVLAPRQKVERGYQQQTVRPNSLFKSPNHRLGSPGYGSYTLERGVNKENIARLDTQIAKVAAERFTRCPQNHCTAFSRRATACPDDFFGCDRHETAIRTHSPMVALSTSPPAATSRSPAIALASSSLKSRSTALLVETIATPTRAASDFFLALLRLADVQFLSLEFRVVEMSNGLFAFLPSSHLHIAETT